MKNETSIAIQQTSFAISKSRCPRCATMGKDTRRDNYVTYSDSHSICFSCGYLYNPLTSRIQGIRNVLKPEGKPKVWLPSDISQDYIS